MQRIVRNDVYVEPVVCEVRTRPSRALTILTCLAPLLAIILLCTAYFMPVWRTTYADMNHNLVESRPEQGYLYTFGLFTFTVQGINRPAHIDCGNIAHRILMQDDGCALHRSDTECHCWYPSTTQALTSPLWNTYAPGFPALHACRNPAASAEAFNRWRTLGKAGFISCLVVLCLGFVLSFGLVVFPRRKLVHVVVCVSLLVLIGAVAGFVGTYIITLDWSTMCSVEREIEDKYDYPGPSMWIALAAFAPLAMFMIGACFLLVVVRRLEYLADPTRATLLAAPAHTFV